METEQGVGVFLRHNQVPKGQTQAASGSEEEKRMDYRPLKIENNDNLYFCRKVKSCNHQCTGVKGEKTCLPCLEPECITGRLPPKTELCSICYTSELSEEPCV